MATISITNRGIKHIPIKNENKSIFIFESIVYLDKLVYSASEFFLAFFTHLITLFAIFVELITSRAFSLHNQIWLPCLVLLGAWPLQAIVFAPIRDSISRQSENVTQSVIILSTTGASTGASTSS